MGIDNSQDVPSLDFDAFVKVANKVLQHE